MILFQRAGPHLRERGPVCVRAIGCKAERDGQGWGEISCFHWFQSVEVVSGSIRGLRAVAGLRHDAGEIRAAHPAGAAR